MFSRILVALDHSKADAALLPRVRALARLTHARILLLHVSTGWAAQWQQELNLSDSEEIQEDRDYLEDISRKLREEGFEVETVHALGRPPEEILKVARSKNCDLIAMTTHGHRLLSDIIYGETIEKVRHESEIPIFLVRAGAREEGGKQIAAGSG
jgi:nucleotide-binding universal stress UspA family protein